MLLHIWFFMPTLVISHKYSEYQYSTIRKHTIYFLQNSDLDAKTQGIHHYDIVISDDKSTSVLNQFWKSTGLCPPDPHYKSFKYFLSSDMKQNLFHIGSLPYSGITQVRMHWLLDLIQVSILPDLSILYNFTFLDGLVKDMWKNHLHIGFELMGNPSNYFTDFENVTQVYLWRDLIKTVAERYIGFYGIDYVKKWNFETWNEPDHHDFDKLNFTIQGFLNYYDACSEGLKLAHKSLKFGGPGGSCRIPSKGHSPICWALLNHCIKGRNFFTGETGNRLDFISFHKKGNASTILILQEELETIEYMRNIIKIPSNVPFYNDEADPLKNWALPQQWRADVFYGAMVAKIIISHIKFYLLENETRYIHYDLLSNDNAFLSYFPNQFTQRTLLARFQVNNTVPKYVDFVKKPVYTVFGLLSQLCHNILHTKVHHKGKLVQDMDEFGIIATSCAPDSDQIVIVIYNSADTISSNATFDIDLSLTISTLQGKNARWVTWELNNIHTNPYLIWKKQNMPAFPTSQQFLEMKAKEGPLVRGPWPVKILPPLKLHLILQSPGVTMISICASHPDLQKVTDVRFMQLRNNSLQISWNDNLNRCILTYIIEYSIKSSVPYIQLNKNKVVFPSYWYYCNENDTYCSTEGFYRIYAVDYWNNHGPFSLPVKYVDP